jgi:hypothetical protein
MGNFVNLQAKSIFWYFLGLYLVRNRWYFRGFRNKKKEVIKNTSD